jgi:hypothetical protein
MREENYLKDGGTKGVRISCGSRLIKLTHTLNASIIRGFYFKELKSIVWSDLEEMLKEEMIHILFMLI